MWNRKEIKSSAKSLLNKYLKETVIACLIFSIVCVIFNSNDNFNTIKVNYNINKEESLKIQYPEDNIYRYNLNIYNENREYSELKKSIQNSDFYKLNDNYALDTIFTGEIPVYVNSTIIIILIIIGILGKIFVVNPMEIGLNKFFLKAYNDDVKISYLFSFFKNGHWKDSSIKLLLRDLEILLWTLLFILPGIYKSFQYYYMPYILAEDPSLTFEEARLKSIDMTEGQKMDLFILNLSFIGWSILASLFFGIGYLILNPYITATVTCAYLSTKKAFEEKKITTIDD